MCQRGWGSVISSPPNVRYHIYILTYSRAVISGREPDDESSWNLDPFTNQQPSKRSSQSPLICTSTLYIHNLEIFALFFYIETLPNTRSHLLRSVIAARFFCFFLRPLNYCSNYSHIFDAPETLNIPSRASLRIIGTSKQLGPRSRMWLCTKLVWLRYCENGGFKFCYPVIALANVLITKGLWTRSDCSSLSEDRKVDGQGLSPLYCEFQPNRSLRTRARFYTTQNTELTLEFNINRVNNIYVALILIFDVYITRGLSSEVRKIRNREKRYWSEI